MNDATSVVLFRAIEKFDFDDFNALTALSIIGNFFYLFVTSTALGIAVSNFLAVCKIMLELGVNLLFASSFSDL